jgi:hypothetical protein
MARAFIAEEDHVAGVLKRLAEYEGLEHVRARRRADLLTLESGPRDDVVPHTRFRRVGVHRWQIEMPLKGGGWDRTPMRGQLIEALDAVITRFPWMLAPRH